MKSRSSLSWFGHAKAGTLSTHIGNVSDALVESFASLAPLPYSKQQLLAES